jgi:hypothetical protein
LTILKSFLLSHHGHVTVSHSVYFWTFAPLYLPELFLIITYKSMPLALEWSESG